MIAVDSAAGKRFRLLQINKTILSNKGVGHNYPDNFTNNQQNLINISRYWFHWPVEMWLGIPAVTLRSLFQDHFFRQRKDCAMPAKR